MIHFPILPHMQANPSFLPAVPPIPFTPEVQQPGALARTFNTPGQGLQNPALLSALFSAGTALSNPGSPLARLGAVGANLTQNAAVAQSIRDANPNAPQVSGGSALANLVNVMPAEEQLAVARDQQRQSVFEQQLELGRQQEARLERSSQSRIAFQDAQLGDMENDKSKLSLASYIDGEGNRIWGYLPENPTSVDDVKFIPIPGMVSGPDGSGAQEADFKVLASIRSSLTAVVAGDLTVTSEAKRKIFADMIRDAVDSGLFSNPDPWRSMAELMSPTPVEEVETEKGPSKIRELGKKAIEKIKETLKGSPKTQEARSKAATRRKAARSRFKAPEDRGGHLGTGVNKAAVHAILGSRNEDGTLTTNANDRTFWLGVLSDEDASDFLVSGELEQQKRIEGVNKLLQDAGGTDEGLIRLLFILTSLRSQNEVAQ